MYIIGIISQNFGGAQAVNMTDQENHVYHVHYKYLIFT